MVYLKMTCATKSAACELAWPHLQFPLISLDPVVGVSFGSCFGRQECVLDKCFDLCTHVAPGGSGRISENSFSYSRYNLPSSSGVIKLRSVAIFRRTITVAGTALSDT